MAENTPSNFLSPDEQEAMDMICQDLKRVIEGDYAAEPAVPAPPADGEVSE